MSALGPDVRIEPIQRAATDEQRAVTPWRATEDPFAGALPVAHLSALVGGLPDAREPEEILVDLACCRQAQGRK